MHRDPPPRSEEAPVFGENSPKFDRPRKLGPSHFGRVGGGGGGAGNGSPGIRGRSAEISGAPYGWLARSSSFAGNAADEVAQPSRRNSINFDKFAQIDPRPTREIGIGANGDQRRIGSSFGGLIGNIGGSSSFAANATAADDPPLAQIPKIRKIRPHRALPDGAARGTGSPKDFQRTLPKFQRNSDIRR